MKLDRFIVKEWLIAVLPIVVIVVCGMTVFKEQVISSIKSTPHPELVYIILGTFGAGVIVSYVALFRFTRERMTLLNGYENIFSSKSKWLSDAMPIYQILNGNYFIVSSKRHSVLEQEFLALKIKFENRLSVSHFIAGALVGLGLVGTFIGLLGAMGDLGKLFEVLGSVQNNVSPVDLFTDMVKRLQEPMKGMGTAFVSSLYGLMGSIVIGGLGLIVSHFGHVVLDQINELVRNNEYGTEVCEEEIVNKDIYDDLASLATQVQNSTKQWQLVFNKMQQEHESSVIEAKILRGEVLSVTSAIKELSSLLKAKIDKDEVVQEENPVWIDPLIECINFVGTCVENKSEKNEEILKNIEKSELSQQKTLKEMVNLLGSLEKRVDGHISAFFKSNLQNN